MKSVLRQIHNKFLALFFFNKWEMKAYEVLSFNKIIFLNYIVQRIFRINRGIKYSVHFTSKVSNNQKGFIIEGDSDSVLKSLALSGGCYISVHSGSTLKIGKGTLWAYNVCIVTGNHDFFDRDKYIIKNVTIGRNCWIAAGACIMPGVTLGDNVTVAANAVVTKSFPNNVIIGGVPAKVLKSI